MIGRGEGRAGRRSVTQGAIVLAGQVGRLRAGAVAAQSLTWSPPLVTRLTPCAARTAGAPALPLLATVVAAAEHGHPATPTDRPSERRGEVAREARPVVAHVATPVLARAPSPVVARPAVAPPRQAVMASPHATITPHRAPSRSTPGSVTARTSPHVAVAATGVVAPDGVAAPAAVAAPPRAGLGALARRVGAGAPADRGAGRFDVPVPRGYTTPPATSTSQSAPVRNPPPSVPDVGGTPPHAPGIHDADPVPIRRPDPAPAGVATGPAPVRFADLAQVVAPVVPEWTDHPLDAPRPAGDPSSSPWIDSRLRVPEHVPLDPDEVADVLAELLAQEAEAHGLDGRLT